MKTKQEILNATTAHEVLAWMKETPPPHDAEVAEYFNRLAQKEFAARIPNYDPEMHYDFLSKRVK